MVNHNIAAWLFVLKDLEPEPHLSLDDSSADLYRIKVLFGAKAKDPDFTLENMNSYYEKP